VEEKKKWRALEKVKKIEGSQESGSKNERASLKGRRRRTPKKEEKDNNMAEGRVWGGGALRKG